MNIDEITIWLALVSIILLAASEVLSSYHGRVYVSVNRKRLRNVSMVMSVIFLASVAVRVVNIILS